MEKGKGGILRSEKNGGVSGGTVSRDHGHVSFSNNNVERTIPPRTPNNTSTNNGGGGYDSDDVEDSIMASGDTFAMGGGKRGHNSDDHDMNDASVKTLSEIEEAKRKRGRVRRREDEVEGSTAHFDKDDKHYTNSNDMSLITDQDKNPDEYETNAGINAGCPVEPFNMNAEKDGGLGYFDGDTYVFRHNQKPVDGEDDAWLDGLGEDNEKETGGGGLDSTSIWKPSSSDTKSAGYKGEQSKRKSKFVSEDDIPEDIGRRMATLLQDDNETVMMALTRHGASIRQLQSQQQKLAKKSKIKKRKPSKSKKEDDITSTTSSSSSDNIDAEVKQLKMKVEQTRECVEELTELADALLFGGETEAYELTKSDWIHKFKLEQYFPTSSAAAIQRKRPLEGEEDTQSKKKSKGYFDTNTEETKTETHVATNTNKPSVESTVMWEYKGNEDGTIHGPYTSQQMKDWTSCGYFVGESAVDIRRVGSSDTGKSDNKQESKEEDTKADVDDLMADLMDDDEEETKEESENTSAAWMRSDRVDFSLYL